MKPEVAASMADKWLKRVDISDRIAELRAQGVSLSLAAEPRVRLAFMFRVALFAGKIEPIFRRWYPQSHGRAS
jgi:hypothetical protein